MKKTSIILCALATGFFAGCSDDDEATKPQVTVVDINFKAAAAEGYILLNGQPATAVASETWCNLRQEGDTIFVSVSDNTDLEGRNAVVTVTYADGTQKQIPINQQGGFFRVEETEGLHATDAADALTLDVASAFDYTVTVASDWVSYEKNEEGVTFKFEANDTRAPRHTTVTIRCEKMDKQYSTRLYQYNIGDLMGEWEASFINQYNQPVACDVSLSKATDGTITLTGMPEALTLKARSIDEHVFGFKLGEDLGFYQDIYKTYLGGVNTKGIIYSHDTEKRKVNYKSALQYTSEGYECCFAADSTFTDGTTMDGIAVIAYDLNGNNLGQVEFFRQLKLKR